MIQLTELLSSVNDKMLSSVDERTGSLSITTFKQISHDHDYKHENFRVIKVWRFADFELFCLFLHPQFWDSLYWPKQKNNKFVHLSFCDGWFEHEKRKNKCNTKISMFIIPCFFVKNSRKFKGGICCGSHLAITYGGELLYLRICS